MIFKEKPFEQKCNAFKTWHHMRKLCLDNKNEKFTIPSDLKKEFNIS